MTAVARLAPGGVGMTADAVGGVGMTADAVGAGRLGMTVRTQAAGA
jgi:hypothetical protein